MEALQSSGLPTLFHLGWAGILLVLVGLALLPSRRQGGVRGGADAPSRTARPRRPSLLLQLGLAGVVVAWGAWSLATVARDHGPGLEVRGYVLEPPASGPAALSLGTGEAADVLLADPWADTVHAIVRWQEGPSGLEPWIWNASASRRLEVDGRSIHEVDLEPGTALVLGDDALEVVGTGRWPSVELRRSDGEVVRLGAPVGRGLATMLPRVGSRLRTRLGTLSTDEAGRTVVDPDLRPLPGTGAVATLVLRGRQPVLAFAGPADRAEHDVQVALPDQEAFRPADRWTRLQDGQSLSLGYSRFAVQVDRSGRLELTSVGNPARLDWPGEQATVLGAAPGLLAVGDAHGDTLRLASLDPTGARGFRRVDGVFVEGSGGRPRVGVSAGDRVELPLADGARVRLRVARRAEPMAALAGLVSAADEAAWRSFVLLAILYLLLVLVASRAGLLHARSAGVLHGAALLFVVGLLCLYRLSDPGDVRRAGWVLRQAQLGAIGLGVATALAAGSAFMARLREPLPGRLFAWLDGRSGEGVRARWLYVLAVVVLALQLPFGETGIAVVGLGSVQPIELARTLLVLYLAYWTVRAVEAKRDHMRGSEGLAQRWSYMVHALPVVAVLVLCYGLNDISPILVFVAFLAVLYLASVLRPSLRLWPPRAWRDSLALELAVAGVVLAGVCWLVLADPSGTVATRLRTWWDPWSHSSEAYQAVTALWATASGGLFGLGWTGENGVLPPAVKDDFILALLAARGGVVAVTLVAATFGAILLSGVTALTAPGSLARQSGHRERSTMLAAAVLWMLAIQAAVVLGSATGGLPVMGQPLPFVAAAGSHLLLFCLPAVGLVLGATRVRVPCAARSPRPARALPVQPAFGWDSISVHPITEGGG